MQWLINEFKAFKQAVLESVQKVETKYEDRIVKLEGELKAMKARMGKKE